MINKMVPPSLCTVCVVKIISDIERRVFKRSLNTFVYE